MNNSLKVHKVDSRHEFGHDPSGLTLVKLVVPLPDPGQQLAALEVLGHDVGVGLVFYHIHEFDNVWVALTQSEQLDLSGAIDSLGDDLDSELLASGLVRASATDGEGAFAQNAFV